MAAQAGSDGRRDRGSVVRLPSQRPSPPTLLSSGGDTSNLASCSPGTSKNKSAGDHPVLWRVFSTDSASPVSPLRSAVTPFRRPGESPLSEENRG